MRHLPHFAGIEPMPDELASELLPRSAMESEVGITVCDLEGRFMMVNDKYLRITGYTADELIGRKYASITHPDDLEGNLGLASSLFADMCSNFVYEKRYIRKDGRIVRVRNSVSLVRDSAGKAFGAVCLCQDITADELAGFANIHADRGTHQLANSPFRSHDRERQRIFSELHENSVELLAGMSVTLSRLRHLEPENSPKRELWFQALDLLCQCARGIRTLTAQFSAEVTEKRDSVQHK